MKGEASRLRSILLIVFVFMLVASFDNCAMIKSVYGLEREYAIEITSVETGLGTEADWISNYFFFHSELMSVNVTVMSNAENLTTARISVTAFDDLNQPFDFSAKNLTLGPGESRNIYCQIYIPNWALPGEGCRVVATAEVLPEGTASPQKADVFYILSIDPIHNLSLLDVMPFETEVYVGWKVHISAIIRNEGSISESFAVIYKYELEGTEYTINETTAINLFPRAGTDVIFTWTTTDIGTHKVIAEIPVLENETDTSDNIMASSIQVRVKIFGDVNGDNKVNMQDVGQTSLAFGSAPADPRWNIQTDLNQDNRTNLMDVALVARNFGKSHP